MKHISYSVGGIDIDPNKPLCAVDDTGQKHDLGTLIGVLKGAKELRGANAAMQSQLGKADELAEALRNSHAKDKEKWKDDMEVIKGKLAAEQARSQNAETELVRLARRFSPGAAGYDRTSMDSAIDFARACVQSCRVLAEMTGHLGTERGAHALTIEGVNNAIEAVKKWKEKPIDTRLVDNTLLKVAQLLDPNAEQFNFEDVKERADFLMRCGESMLKLAEHQGSDPEDFDPSLIADDIIALLDSGTEDDEETVEERVTRLERRFDRLREALEGITTGV